MIDECVEVERPSRKRHVAHVVPIGDVDVVIREQSARRSAQQCREMT